LRPILIVLSVLSAAACSQSAVAQAQPDPTAISELPGRGGDGGPRGEGGPRGGPERRPIQLFISPSGEPFRVKAGQPYPSIVWFNRANTAHDGKLTRAEFIADAESFFSRLDVNHDQVIDGFENQDYEQKVAPEILPRLGGLNAEDAGYGKDAPGIGRDPGTPHRRGGGGSGGGRPHKGANSLEGAAPYSYFDEPQPVAGADADFDQKVTLAEFRKAAGERFDLLDKKHQGYLVYAELPKTPIQRATEQAEAERLKHEKKGAKPLPEASPGR
jgi:hypothetical protein